MVDPIEKVSLAVPSFSEPYAKTVPLRVAIQCVPYVGSALDLLLTEGSRQLAEERLRYFFAGLDLDVSRLKAESLNQAYLSSAKFYDLLRAALEDSVRAGENEKIRLNSRILAGAIVLSPSIGMDEPALFIKILSGLDARDIYILRIIIDSQANSPMTDNQSQYDWAVERTWQRFHELTQHSLHDAEVPYRVIRLTNSGCLNEIYPQQGKEGHTRAFVPSLIVHQMRHWLERFGGFPSEADIKAAQEKADLTVAQAKVAPIWQRGSG